jgi:hypothetical protein
MEARSWSYEAHHGAVQAYPRAINANPEAMEVQPGTIGAHTRATEANPVALEAHLSAMGLTWSQVKKNTFGSQKGSIESRMENNTVVVDFDKLQLLTKFKHNYVLDHCRKIFHFFS